MKDNNTLRKRVFRMVSVGIIDEPLNKFYDIFSTAALLVNLAAASANTFNSMSDRYGSFLSDVEAVTVAFFAVDYVLRVYTAPELYPGASEAKAIRKYVLSMSGIIDILSFLPYYLPWFFPSGATAFRMFRVARIMRLFRINAYYDSLNVITEVIISKKQQLLSSVFIIIVMMLASSLCMYSLENQAQPDVFSNAFSGIWWATSTLLTIGYGDIYPVTTGGKIMAAIISFLGVGMVAIPTGIISAGFVEQYSRLKKLGERSIQENIRFIRLRIEESDGWAGKKIQDLGLPKGMLIAAIQREQRTLIPRGPVAIKAGDQLVIGAESLKDATPVNLKALHIGVNHPWNGQMIKDLDISRQTFIVMVRRNGEGIVPKGDTVIQIGDELVMYSKVHDEGIENEAVSLNGENE